jgi:glycosyltransferase involved in cell wall biosynthesis
VKRSCDITIPVFNEEETLKKQVLRLHNYLSESLNNFKWKIVIADNGSEDNTADIAKELELEYESIKLVSVGEKGVGRALKASWCQSEADILSSMDLDLSTDVRHIPDALSCITSGKFDIVYGSRLHKKSNVTGRSLTREITSRIFNFIVRNYLGVHISDGMCGFTFLKKEILNDLLNKGSEDNRWFFQTEILVVSEWLGYKIYELPVKWEDDPNSKVKIIPLAIEYLKGMRELKKRKKKLFNKNK